MAACEERLRYYCYESEKSYVHTIKIKPAYYVAYIYLSRLYFAEGNFQKVIDFDKRAIDNGTQSDVIYVTLGNAYLMVKDTDNAVFNYEKSMRFYDKNYYICGFLNKYYVGKGDAEKARYYKQMYDSAMIFKNSHPVPH